MIRIVKATLFLKANVPRCLPHLLHKSHFSTENVMFLLQKFKHNLLNIRNNIILIFKTTTFFIYITCWRLISSIIKELKKKVFFSFFQRILLSVNKKYQVNLLHPLIRNDMKSFHIFCRLIKKLRETINNWILTRIYVKFFPQIMEE